MKKRFIALPVALAVFVACTVAAYAVVATDDLADTSARYVPADALAFASIAVEPSLGQQAKLFAMSQNFPEGYRPTQAETSGSEIISSAIGDDMGVEDITPWLGAEAAGALLRPFNGGTAPLPIAYLQVKNQALAQQTLLDHGIEPTSYRFVGEYLLMVDGYDIEFTKGTLALDAAQQLIENEGAESLATTERYKQALTTLHNEHLALAWMDLPALLEVTQFLSPENDLGLNYLYGLPNNETIVDQVTQTGSIAMQAYATTDSVVMRMTTENLVPELPVSDGALLKGLPSDTIAAVDLADFDPSAPGGMIEQLRTPYAWLEDPAVSVDPATSSVPSTVELSEETERVVSLLATMKGEAVAGIGASDSGVYNEIPFVVSATSKDPAASEAALRGVLADVVANDGVVATAQDVAGAQFVKLTTSTQPSLRDVPSSGLVDVMEPTLVAQSEPVPSFYVGISDNRIYLGNDLDYLARTVTGTNSDLGATDGFARGIGDISAQPLLGALYVDIASSFDLAKRVSTTEGSVIKPEDAAWLDAMEVGGLKTWNKADHTIVEATIVFG